MKRRKPGIPMPLSADGTMPRMVDSLTLTRPDDWHLHLRDGAALAAVLPASARQFARAIVMPNLRPPITTAALALAYREAPSGKDASRMGGLGSKNSGFPQKRSAQALWDYLLTQASSK